jgi:hypothetical protein
MDPTGVLRHAACLLALTVVAVTPVRAADVTGDYTGTWRSEVEDESGELSVTLTQSGDQVTGSLEITNVSCLGVATIAGRLDGAVLTGTYTGTLGSTGRGEFELLADDDGLTGSYEMTGGCFVGDHGTFVLVRSGPGPTFTPTGTRPPGPTPTFTPRRGPCVGDCGHDGVVGVDDLVLGVQIALGRLPLSACPEFDVLPDGRVTIDELTQSIKAARDGCTPAGVTPTAPPPGSFTPTATPTFQPPTPVPDAPSVARRAAGTIQTASQMLLTLPPLLSLFFVSADGAGADGAGAGPGVTVPCLNGGTLTIGCVQIPFRNGKPTYTLTADRCLTDLGDLTALLDGSATVIDETAGHRCLVDRPTSASVTIPALSIEMVSAASTTTTTLTAVEGTIALSGSDPTCTYDRIDARLTGTAHTVTETPDGTPLTTTEAAFDHTGLVLIVHAFADQCIANAYALTVNGRATFTTDGQTLAATYTDFRLEVADATAEAQIDISGSLASECFGRTVRFNPEEPLRVPGAGECPLSGAVRIDADGAHLIEFEAVGLVHINYGNDQTRDETFPTCADPRLFICPNS